MKKLFLFFLPILFSNNLIFPDRGQRNEDGLIALFQMKEGKGTDVMDSLGSAGS